MILTLTLLLATTIPCVGAFLSPGILGTKGIITFPPYTYGTTPMCLKSSPKTPPPSTNTLKIPETIEELAKEVSDRNRHSVILGILASTTP